MLNKTFICKILIFYTLVVSFNVNGTEFNIISPEEYINENPSVEREAIINFITQQFNMHKKVVVTQTDLDKLWNNIDIRNASYMARFQIIDQKLYTYSYDIKNDRFYEMSLYLKNIISKHKINNVDFIMYMRDEIPEETFLRDQVSKVPAFMMSKDINSPYEKNMFLFPDNHLIINNWQSLSKKILEANIKNSWDNKENKIFWRGATTGGAYNINNFSKLPRLSLTILSKLYPDLIDAKFAHYAQISNNKEGHALQNVLDTLNLRVSTVKEIDHLKYKYLMSIDGNNCAWGRPVWIMLSNSVLVKQETSKMEWFYSAIKPYVHYVPVNERLTNIFEQIEWMKTHDTELQQISQNAQNFVKNNLMPEHIEAHAVIILNEYSKLHKGNKIMPTLPSVEETLAILEKKKEEVEKNKQHEAEKNMPRKKKIQRFFKELKEKIKTLWL